MATATEILELKDHVRARDGYKCVDCGMTQDDYFKQTERILDVHRLMPGSEYSEEGCVTVCRSCHDTRHSEIDGTTNGNPDDRIELLVTEAWMKMGFYSIERRRKLSARQREIFNFFAGHLLDHQRTPTIREIADRFGISSPNGVMCHINALLKKGFLEVDGTTEKGNRHLKIAGTKLALIDESESSSCAGQPPAEQNMMEKTAGKRSEEMFTNSP